MQSVNAWIDELFRVLHHATALGGMKGVSRVTLHLTNVNEETMRDIVNRGGTVRALGMVHFATLNMLNAELVASRYH